MSARIPGGHVGLLKHASKPSSTVQPTLDGDRQRERTVVIPRCRNGQRGGGREWLARPTRRQSLGRLFHKAQAP